MKSEKEIKDLLKAIEEVILDNPGARNVYGFTVDTRDGDIHGIRRILKFILEE